MHNGEIVFLVKYMALQVSLISSFKSHKEVNTGERPYICKVCGSLFHLSQIWCGMYKLIMVRSHILVNFVFLALH